jgi:hypothetical protein
MEISTPSSGWDSISSSGTAAFIVEERLTGPIVTPLDELEAAAREPRPAGTLPRSPEGDTAIRDAEAAAEELIGEIGEPADRQPQPSPPPLVQREGIEVNGRAGRGYYYRRFDNDGEDCSS